MALLGHGSEPVLGRGQRLHPVTLVPAGRHSPTAVGNRLHTTQGFPAFPAVVGGMEILHSRDTVMDTNV